MPSNIEVHNQIIPSKNLKSQQHLNLINDWTKKKKMKLNENKKKISSSTLLKNISLLLTYQSIINI